MTTPPAIDTLTEAAPAPGGAGDAGDLSPGSELPQLRLDRWMETFPGLVAGITCAPFDMALLGSGTTADVLPRWEVLRAATGADAVVHARQVHGSALRHTREAAPGLAVLPPADGHLTRRPGVLLTVSVADCVPIYLLDPGRRAVALLHSGWRSAAAGILEGGIERLGDAFGTRPAELHLHLGPSICGSCYEVGPEVFEALGLPAPPAPTPIDLRAVLVERAVAAGVPRDAITRSSHCTKCGDAGLWSHRGGDPERQVAFLGFVGPSSIGAS